MKSAFLSFVMIFASQGLGALPLAEPQEHQLKPQALALVDQTLRHFVDSGAIPGFVAGVARNGEIVYLGSAGWQDVEQAVPMRDDAIFQIRSMSKPIASLAVMQLIERGQLELDDAVSTFIPAFADMRVFSDPEDFDSETVAAHREMTVRDLLLHIGGLSHRDRTLYQRHQVRSRSDTLAELVDKVAAVPLISQPGTQWNYSISTTVLGRIVEVVSGLAFDDYLQQHVFSPLQMHDSGFYVHEEKAGQLTEVYRLQESGMQKMPPMDVPVTVDPPLKEGAAGMVSTVGDYLRFLQMFLNAGELDGQRLLSEEGVRLMTENQLAESIMPITLFPPNPMRDLGWGYGFSVVVDGGHSPYPRNDGEFGWNGSLGTFSWADPQTGLVAVLMLQIQPSGAHNLAALFKTLVWSAVQPAAE
ncbi:serine hydrolase domain-containing protein [Pseudohongiella spirulinae]|uniref:Beta-lactamase n=1 Tax=Pseudohongiella spirulinae TaxID=1249552 RepID=A0A0S2KFN1_9GAMM|nr:serine hydrolase domain-containing protein [Pseudohongiella spirulinae]ALO47049.1 Beta-lactamase [Pseudohongiella spirulinae]